MFTEFLVWLGLRERDGTIVGGGSDCIMDTHPIGIPQNIPQKTSYVECETCGVLVAIKKAKEVDRIERFGKIEFPGTMMQKFITTNGKRIVTDYYCVRCANPVVKKARK